MNYLLIAAVALFASSGTTATVTCNGIVCFRGGIPKKCEELDRFCCKGPGRDEWRTRHRLLNHACCTGSGQTYNKLSQVCDNGEIRSKGENEEVCGSKTVYNTTVQKCCRLNETHGKVYPKEEGECCNETNLLDRDLSCCKGIVFNRTQQTCCPTPGNIGYLLHNVPNGKCCQDLPYNPATETCLNDRPHVINKSESEIQYCGNKSFNNATGICCSGKIGNRATQLCHTKRHPPILVDKDDPNDNAVCENSARTSYHTYYTGPNNRKACISGRVIELGPNQDVCDTRRRGLFVYNTSSDLCCGGMKFYENGLLQGLKCCPNRYSVYNPTDQICCSGIISSFSEKKGAKCCRDKAYYPKKHICFHGMVRKAMCYVKGKPLYPQRCNFTSEHLNEIQRAFHGKGLYVYVVNVTSTPTSKGKWKSWDLENVVQVAAKNKKQPERIVLNEKNDVKLRARKCSCPFELTPNKRYFIFSDKKIKNGIINIKAKEQGYSNRNDAIIPSDSDKLNNLMKVIFSDGES